MPKSQRGTAERWNVGCWNGTDSSSGKHGARESVLRDENGHDGKEAEKETEKPTTRVKTCAEKLEAMMNVEELNKETISMVERIVALRVSDKQNNLWMRQLEMKRREIAELAGLMELEGVKNEIEHEKNLEVREIVCTKHFAKRTKIMLYEEIDNMVWSGKKK